MIRGSRLCTTFVSVHSRETPTLTKTQRQAITPGLLWASLTDYDMYAAQNSAFLNNISNAAQVANLPHRPHMDNPHGTPPSSPAILPLTSTDTTSKLPNPNAQSTRLLDFQHQPLGNPLLRTLHPPTPILDLGLREDEPAIPRRAHEPSVGDPASDRARDAACQVPAQQLGALRYQLADCGVSLCACDFGYISLLCSV